MAANSKAPAEGEINTADAKFVFECLKHIDDSKNVDLVAVATALNYTNVASVGNRFRAMRKRYGFSKLDCTGTSNKLTKLAPTDPQVNQKAGLEDDSSSEPVEEKTPVATKGKKKGASPRKGAKVTTKPVPATEKPNKTKAKKEENDAVVMNDLEGYKAEEA